MTLSRREMLQATAAAMAMRLLKVPAAGSPPKFLTPAEFALLDELTDMIIPTDAQSPGARAAGVAPFMDGWLAQSLDKEFNAKWRDGLKTVDALSQEMNGKTFVAATADQRLAVLTRMAAGEADPKTPAERFFKELKGATTWVYYTSSIGIHNDQEYKGNVVQPGEYAGFDAT